MVLIYFIKLKSFNVKKFLIIYGYLGGIVYYWVVELLMFIKK